MREDAKGSSTQMAPRPAEDATLMVHNKPAAGHRSDLGPRAGAATQNEKVSHWAEWCILFHLTALSTKQGPVLRKPASVLSLQASHLDEVLLAKWFTGANTHD